MSQHSEYVKFIQQAVETICPYEDEHLRRLYHAGFLASYLATLLEKDSFHLREFKRHVEKIKKTKK